MQKYQNSNIANFLEDLTDEMNFFVSEIKTKPRQSAYYFLNFMLNFFTLKVTLTNLLDFCTLDDEESRERFLTPFNRFFNYVPIMEKLYIDVDECEYKPYIEGYFLNKNFSKVMERFGYNFKDYWELLKIKKLTLDNVLPPNRKTPINLNQFSTYKIDFLKQILTNKNIWKIKFKVPTIFPNHWDSYYENSDG